MKLIKYFDFLLRKKNKEDLRQSNPFAKTFIKAQQLGRRKGSKPP